MQSMTGFGRGSEKMTLGSLVVEITSLNRKFLEISLNLPKELSAFEIEIRKQVAKRVTRGQIYLRVQLFFNAKSLQEKLPDQKALLELKKGWEKIAVGLNVNPESIDLPFLFEQMPKETEWSEQRQKYVLRHLQKAIEKALDALLEMKTKEGKALAQDLLQRLSFMEKAILSIAKLAPQAKEKMRKKLLEKLQSLFTSQAELEEKVLREVALFAEKIDISEEITRLKSHFEQMKRFLKEKKSSLGKKIDFLAQEMGREINTIASKALDAKISQFVVDLKSELEKIREQAQNIE